MHYCHHDQLVQYQGSPILVFTLRFSQKNPQFLARRSPNLGQFEVFQKVAQNEHFGEIPQQLLYVPNFIQK